MRQFKKEQIYYHANLEYGHPVDRIKVLEVHPSSDDFYRVKVVDSSDRTVELKNALSRQIFHSETEALEYRDKMRLQIQAYYAKSISTVEDLINFMLVKNISDKQKNGDYNARCVVLAKMDEFGLELK